MYLYSDMPTVQNYHVLHHLRETQIFKWQPLDIKKRQNKC